MEDTFVGGNTSDVSIILWFVIAGILSLITFMFLFFLKIKDLKSQKIILYSVTIFWIIVSFSLVLISKLTFYPYLITILTSLFCFLAIKNLKIEIITELNKKGLTEKEIYLLQKLAGIKNNNNLVGPPGLEPGTNTL